MSPTLHGAGVDGARDDAPVVALLGELVDVLDRHPERTLDRRRLAVERVERIEHRRPVVPAAGCADRSAMLSPPRPETGMNADGRIPTWSRNAPYSRTIRSNTAAVPVHQVHLVHHHRELPDAEQRHHVPVAAGVLLHALGGVDHQQRGLGAGGAGDHVLEELDVARRVEDQVVPPAALEEHPGGVDGDALGLLVLERVEQEGVLERLRVELALGPDLLELAFGQASGCRRAGGR